MQKLVVTFALTLFAFHASFAQPSQNLETLCKLWGFLKYYHPAVAGGARDWDAELLQRIEPVQTAASQKELDALHLAWLDELGPLERCKKCGNANPDWFEENFDLGWTDDTTTFSPEMIRRLDAVEQNRFQGVNHFATYHPNVGNVQFTNEAHRDSSDFPPVEQRLLALFRYWNQVNYFFPYKYQSDVPWDSTLAVMIPRFVHAADAVEYHKLLLELVSSINDSHAYLVSPVLQKQSKKYRLPLLFRFVDNQLAATGTFSTEIAGTDNWFPGDVVTAVEGVPVDTLFARLRPFLPASNESGKRVRSANALLRSDSETASYTVVRNGKPLMKTARCYPDTLLFKRMGKTKQASSTASPVEAWDIRSGNVGYLNMGLLKAEQVDEAMKDLTKCKGIVFDLRHGSQGTLHAVADYLHTEPTPFAYAVLPDFTYPGKFFKQKPATCGKRNKKSYRGRVVILVNETTQSHAEYTAMCLQSVPGSVTVGSQTAGADGNVSRFELAGGYQTSFSGIGIFYPDGTPTQRVGVRVDVHVADTVADLVARRDAQLEKALVVASGK